MEKPFFTGWELWQKLVFILGCGSALTITLGGAKLAHTHWQLRKHSAVAEKERQEQALHREMSQRRRGPGVPRADEVPFGIRALERGVEVEGVWVSRDNTPEPSIRKESTASSIWDFMPKNQTEQDLERQELPQQRENGYARQSRNSHAKPDSDVAGAYPKDLDFKHAATPGMRASGPSADGAHQKLPTSEPKRSRHPPPSFAKYSGNPSLHRLSSSVQTFEGIEAVYRASTYLNPQANHGGSSSESYTQSSSGSSSSGSDPISSAAPKLLNQSRQARPRHHSADFELLNSHRVSQAAETGQLTPRTRRPTQSMELQGYVSDAVTSSDPEDSGYFGKKATTAASTPPSPSEKRSSPKVAALPAAVRRSSIPDVTPFAQFVQTAPALPRPVSLRSFDEEERKRAKSSPPIKPATTLPSAASTPTCLAEPALTRVSDQTVAGAMRPSFEKERRFSQVVRGHGTGFEILKPGSLKHVMPPMSPEPPERQQYSLPPLSLQKYKARSRSSSVGSTGRKLQKKRRPSFESQASLESTRGRG
ncbi:hypothetical protein Q7P37_001481 [Cladosporium fusiforme]